MRKVYLVTQPSGEHEAHATTGSLLHSIKPLIDKDSYDEVLSYVQSKRPNQGFNKKVEFVPYRKESANGYVIQILQLLETNKFSIPYPIN